MKIFSKIEPNVLLHIITKEKDIVQERHNITPEDKFLQIGAMKLNNLKTFKPHKHIINNRKTDRTHESWIVIRGKIKAILYDLDNNIIHEEILYSGDCTVTFQGGHTYECLEDNTLAYEFKNGPYYGMEADKISI
jgi:cupin fold WbuC family metalloprotein